MLLHFCIYRWKCACDRRSPVRHALAEAGPNLVKYHFVGLPWRLFGIRQPWALCSPNLLTKPSRDRILTPHYLGTGPISSSGPLVRGQREGGVCRCAFSREDAETAIGCVAGRVTAAPPPRPRRNGGMLHRPARPDRYRHSWPRGGTCRSLLFWTEAGFQNPGSQEF